MGSRNFGVFSDVTVLVDDDPDSLPPFLNQGRVQQGTTYNVKDRVNEDVSSSDGDDELAFDDDCHPYADWYEMYYGKQLDCSHVLPVLQALQSHPEPEELFKGCTNKILLLPDIIGLFA